MASTTTGYFDSSITSYGWYARLEYSYTQSTSTTVTLTLKVYNGTTPAYNNNANSAYYEIQGVKTYATYSWTGTSLRTIGSRTITVPAGQTSIDLSAIWVSNVSSTYTPASLSVSGTITVPEIVIEKPLTVSNILSSKNCIVGDTVDFSITASGGNGSYSYQWYYVSSAGATSSIQGATRSTYSRTVVLSDNGGSIYCTITSDGKSVSTNRCLLTVVEAPIVVPLNLARIGTSDKFGIYVPMIYQGGKWVACNWNALSGSVKSGIVGQAVVGTIVAG